MTVRPILDFVPLLKELVWGGRKLETVLRKSLPTDGPYGESWEIVDLPENQSVVSKGQSKGRSLASLLEESREAVLGDAALLDGRFPLLVKFIDAKQTLSVQVHPDEVSCARIGEGARPKTEAWYIIDREPDAKLYAGLKTGTTAEDLRTAIEAGTVATVLNAIAVNPGDFVFLPAGTIHAIGAGVLLAEVQQSSNTTYRVFDWNRVGLDGKPRELHLEKALVATDFTQTGTPKMAAPASGRPGVRSAFFEMEKVSLDDGTPAALTGRGPLILMGVGGGGKCTIDVNGETSTFALGETRLVPAIAAAEVSLRAFGPMDVLAVRIPE